MHLVWSITFQTRFRKDGEGICTACVSKMKLAGLLAKMAIYQADEDFSQSSFTDVFEDVKQLSGIINSLPNAIDLPQDSVGRDNK